MTRISSKFTTVFHKRALPIFWFGFLALFFCAAGVRRAIGQQVVDETTVVFLIGPLAMAIFGYAMFRLLVFDLVDEVWDCGDFLVVCNKGQELRIPLSDCLNVSHTMLTNPPRVTIHLSQSTTFGRQIAFIPPFHWRPFFAPPISKELALRIDAAKRLSSRHALRDIDAASGTE